MTSFLIIHSSVWAATHEIVEKKGYFSRTLSRDDRYYLLRSWNKNSAKTCWTDFVVGLKDVSNSLTYIFLEVKGWHGRNKRSLNYLPYTWASMHVFFLWFSQFGENKNHYRTSVGFIYTFWSSLLSTNSILE